MIFGLGGKGEAKQWPVNTFATDVENENLQILMAENGLSHLHGISEAMRMASKMLVAESVLR